MKIYLDRASNLKSTITFLAFISQRKSISGAREKRSIIAIYHYVELARAVSPTNTSFRLTFLLT